MEMTQHCLKSVEGTVDVKERNLQKSDVPSGELANTEQTDGEEERRRSGS